MFQFLLDVWLLHHMILFLNQLFTNAKNSYIYL